MAPANVEALFGWVMVVAVGQLDMSDCNSLICIGKTFHFQAGEAVNEVNEDMDAEKPLLQHQDWKIKARNMAGKASGGFTYNVSQVGTIRNFTMFMAGTKKTPKYGK